MPDNLKQSNGIGSADFGWPTHSTAAVRRFRDGESKEGSDEVAEEVPVAVVYNGIPHVVMLATPADLDDFAVGFSLTEGIISSVAEIESVRVLTRSDGVEIRVRVPPHVVARLPGKERNLTGRTGCGLCGTESLQQAVRYPPVVRSAIQVTARDIHRAMESLSEGQTLNARTGAVHAAAWALPEKGIEVVREDVGRHNALDKLIGSLLRLRVNRGEGFVIVTSRASYEMVQKCATAGIGLMAAISAPTGLAIRLAAATRVTLIGFARSGAHTLYATPERLVC